MFSNVGFGASIVAINAYLPALAKEAPEVLEVANGRADLSEDTLSEDTEPLLPTSEDNQAEYDAVLSSTTARISSHGIAFGYIAGILLLVVALVPVTMLHGSTWSLRLAIGLSGLWWALGTIPAAMWLPPAEEESGREWKFGREVAGAWMRLGNMLRLSEIRKLKNTFKYLAAWFLLSDGGCQCPCKALF